MPEIVSNGSRLLQLFVDVTELHFWLTVYIIGNYFYYCCYYVYY